jgi:hypothetical protein
MTIRSECGIYTNVKFSFVKYSFRCDSSLILASSRTNVDLSEIDGWKPIDSESTMGRRAQLAIKVRVVIARVEGHPFLSG